RDGRVLRVRPDRGDVRSGGTRGRLELDRRALRIDAMSRAFVKEEEVRDPVCPEPACQGHGEPVTRETLRAHLPEDAWRRLPNGGYFCSRPTCPVVYFDGWGGVAKVDDLLAPVWPKAADASICACFGLTEEDVVADAEKGRRDRVREIVRRADEGA